MTREPPTDARRRWQGAAIGELQGVPAVRHWGEPDAEREVVAAGPALVDRSWADVVEVTGADRVRFVNGLLTNDLQSTVEGDTLYAFFTDVKGKVQADATLAMLPERIWIEVPPGRGETIASHLGKYVVADQVEIRRPDQVALTVLGTSLPPSWDEPATDAAQLAVAGLDIVFVRRELAGAPAVTLWVGAGEADTLWSRLATEVAAAGGRRAGLDALETLRVEQGRPRFGQDFGPDHLPQETGLEGEAVSYDKGCYLGQEVVARLHYRGRANRRLVGLRFAGGLPVAGAELLLDERPVGAATSIATSPRFGGIGLGILHRRAEDGATVLTADGNEALVSPLPFS